MAKNRWRRFNAYVGNKRLVNEYGKKICSKGLVIKKYDGEYSLIMISNSDHVAGVERFHRNVCIDDGELEVLLCTAKTKTQFVKDFILRFLGKESDGIVSMTAKDINIKLIDKPSKKWCIDGEKYEYSGDTFHIKANKKMNILAPRASVEKLFKEEK